MNRTYIFTKDKKALKEGQIIPCTIEYEGEKKHTIARVISQVPTKYSGFVRCEVYASPKYSYKECFAW